MIYILYMRHVFILCFFANKLRSIYYISWKFIKNAHVQ